MTNDFLAPRRTEWVSLDWHGAGANREGLLSYLVRVANAHGISPRLLVRKTFPDGKFGIRVSDASFFENYSGTVNGLGKYAEVFARIVSDKTLTDCATGTFLALKDVLPKNGAGLLSRVCKWCPSCFQAQLEAGQMPWRPLLWSLELYAFCPFHRSPLEKTCPSCGQTQPFIPKWGLLGCCDSCHEPLSQASVQPSVSADDIVGPALEEFVSLLVNSQIIFTVDRFKANILLLVNAMAGGNRAEFCRQIGIQPRALNNWYAKDERPSFLAIARVAIASGVPIASMFGESSGGTLDARFTSARIDRPAAARKIMSPRPDTLALTLQSAAGIYPASAILRLLGVSRSYAKYRSTDQYHFATDAFRQRTDSKRAAKLREWRGCVLQIVNDIRAEGLYPSRRKVETSLSQFGLSLRISEIRSYYQQLLRDSCAQLE